MPAASFFSSLGLFIRSNFFTPDECRQLIKEAREAQAQKATISRKGQEFIDEDVRRTSQAIVSDSTLEMVKDRFLNLIPELNSHFHLEISDSQQPKFLRYIAGDFFTAHSDSNHSHDSSDYVRNRLVTAVVFLNATSDDPAPDTFGGGALTLYGLMSDDPKWESYGFPLTPEPGLLVCFPSILTHEVPPITHGERFTIVGWYT